MGAGMDFGDASGPGSERASMGSLPRFVRSHPNGLIVCSSVNSGILYRMSPSGDDFDVLYTFTQTDAKGANTDGADRYEPLVETKHGFFYGTATLWDCKNCWIDRRLISDNCAVSSMMNRFPRDHRIYRVESGRLVQNVNHTRARVH